MCDGNGLVLDPKVLIALAGASLGLSDAPVRHLSLRFLRPGRPRVGALRRAAGEDEVARGDAAWVALRDGRELRRLAVRADDDHALHRFAVGRGDARAACSSRCSRALRWLVAAWIARQLFARRVPAFLAFGIGVWVSTFVPGVFGWTVASGISPWRSLVQIADVVGERGVSALIAMSSVLLAEAVRASLVEARRDRGRRFPSR